MNNQLERDLLAYDCGQFDHLKEKQMKRKMNIRTAREKALLEKAESMSARQLMSAVIFCGTNSTILALCDVLEIEHKAQKIKNENK